MSPLGRAALAYADRLGWPVFPCAPSGKAPAIAGGRGCLDATTDPEIISGWWQTMPDANVGIALGPIAGVWALDIDDRHDGEESLLEIERAHGPLPDTVEQQTGGGGRHILFRHDARVGNRAGVKPGIDTKSANGYIVAAPSVHPNGRRYVWEVDHHPLEVTPATAPEWLVALVSEPPPDDLGVTAGIAALLKPVPEGRRNATVARLTGYLLRRYVDPHLTLGLVTDWNRSRCEPPLDDAEVHRIVASVCGRELRRRERGA